MELLPCQVEAADEFVKRGGRIFIDSAVGSGKSFAAGECIRRSQEKYPLPALYLTPSFAKKEQVKKLRDCGLDAEMDSWTAKVCVQSFERLVIDFDTARAIPWGIVVVDEADRLTAGASKRNKALLRLQCKHRVMMTGTPLKNGLRDTFMPLMWLPAIPTWKNWTAFSNEELRHDNPLVPHQITGIKNPDKLATLMAHYTYRMVNPEAPVPVKVEVINVTMSDEQQRAYDSFVEESILDVRDGTLIASNKAVLSGRLRQFIAHPAALNHPAPSAKEEALLLHLPTLAGKSIIFTSFSSVARILAERHGWPIIDGKVPNKERTRIIATEPGILIATAAAERSLDMPYLSNVISLDRGYTDAVLTQRGGRANRFGRVGEVRHILLSCPGTVDEKSEERIIKRKLNEARKVYAAQRRG